MHHESQHCSNDFFTKRNTAYEKKAKRDVESMAEGKNDDQDTIFELIGRLCGDWRKPWPRIIYVTTSITSKSREMATNGDRNFDRLNPEINLFHVLHPTPEHPKHSEFTCRDHYFCSYGAHINETSVKRRYFTVFLSCSS